MGFYELKEIDGELYLNMLAAGAAELRKNAGIVNELNVFPIPDGDTGENMCMTIEGGVRSAGDPCAALCDVAGRISDGMLLSARGNSGVLLSQFFSGISDGLQGLESAGIGDFSSAVDRGVAKAYSAVVKPTEGTILTVAREASSFASSRLGTQSTVGSYMSDFFTELKCSLDRTPDLLDVLREAGVVDSGGAGLYYIFEGINEYLDGGSVAGGAPGAAGKQEPSGVDLGKFDENTEMEFGYCTEFLLRLQNAKCEPDRFDIDGLIKYLETVGDSIVAFRDGTVVKVHVHTMKPGDVLNHCQRYGEFLTLKIENMTLQHHETTVRNSFSERAEVTRAERKKFATVAVATGRGIRETFAGLGADAVIDGGQGKNVSPEDFINSFEEVNADTIFVLPNNGNIIMAACQAAELYLDSDIRVIETKDIGQGYAVLSMLSYLSDDADTIENELVSACDGVTTGLVSRSTRDAEIDSVSMKKGDYIGFTSSRMLVSSASLDGAVSELLGRLGAAEHDVIMIIFGRGADAGSRRAAEERTKKEYPSAEIYALDGGQDVYDAIVVLE